MALNDNASRIGIVEFANGRTNALWIGTNTNTGTTIVWQRPSSTGRYSRVTGRNIARLLEELNQVLNEGGARWTVGPEPTLLAALATEA